jgi:hypothetical protein
MTCDDGNLQAGYLHIFWERGIGVDKPPGHWHVCMYAWDAGHSVARANSHGLLRGMVMVVGVEVAWNGIDYTYTLQIEMQHMIDGKELT